MAHIFLCYRSGDDAYAAAYLDERLSRTFGRNAVFRAGRSIPPGDTYADNLERALKDCRYVIVLIGGSWCDRFGPPGDTGERDWVRFEIATAHRNGARTIPILLGQTPRLTPDRLPPDLAFLADRQNLRFDHRTADADVAALIAALSVDEPGGTVPQPATAQRIHRRTPGGGTRSLTYERSRTGGYDIELVSRNADGEVTSRLSGRADATDLPDLVALLDTLTTAPAQPGHP